MTDHSQTPWTPGEWRADLFPDNARWEVRAEPGHLLVMNAGLRNAKYAEANARLIAKAPELAAQLDANTKWLIAERDSLYECISDAEGNIPEGTAEEADDAKYLRELDKLIDQNRALQRAIRRDAS